MPASSPDVVRQPKPGSDSTFGCRWTILKVLLSSNGVVVALRPPAWGSSTGVKRSIELLGKEVITWLRLAVKNQGVIGPSGAADCGDFLCTHDFAGQSRLGCAFFPQLIGIPVAENIDDV